ncbi:hypothetical protein PR002_g18503 [Phytophthora rubi]|uniref:Ubiquitin-like protease family profile domain-containing protein n=1 Tax=Phytophthora rubi TaxID=129364 RepID=A0A6A3JWE8_9STRA|nr:hypothetical protein PR002_g18503 [Phytophthora rubi]
MALQSTPTYSVALQWMQEFYDALQGEDVPKFVMEVSPRIGLEELPQVSSEESTGLTQISIASPVSQTPSAAAAEGDTDDLEEKSDVPVEDESAADHDVQDEDARESGAPSTEEAERRPTSASSDTGPAQNSTKMVPEKPSEGSKDDPISFSQPPRVRGLSKSEKRRIAGDKELREARKLAVKIRDGKKTRKQEYMKAVKGMCLGEVRLGPEWSLGCSLVDFRENLWLHTSSIISAMLALQQMNANVGVVNPSYHDFAGLSVKKKTAVGFGAMDPSNDRIFAVICLDHHWVAYMLDKRTQVCYTFDPLQLKANLATVKSSMQNVIEPQVGMQNKITYKEIGWCKQRDNSSCGVWCLVVLELLLSESPWADSLYKVQPYLRMRYLYKAIAVQETEVAHDED